MKVLSYLEPQNPEYLQFVETLKIDAKKMFNFTIEDSLVQTACFRLFEMRLYVCEVLMLQEEPLGLRQEGGQYSGKEQHSVSVNLI